MVLQQFGAKVYTSQICKAYLGPSWRKREQDKWVFFNAKTGTRYVWRFKLIRGICKRAGMPQYGYHTIRHFVASYLYDKKKCSLPEISKLLRHKNYQTTEWYLQLVTPG